MHSDNQPRPDEDRLERYTRRYKWLPEREHRGFSLNGDVDAFGDESLYRPSELGSAEVHPSRIAAGNSSALKLSYRAGIRGLSAGTSVTFVMRGQRPLSADLGEFAIEGPAGCEFEPVRYGFRLITGAVAPGETVSLTANRFELTPLAGRKEFKVVLRHADDRPEQRLPEPVVLWIEPRLATLAETTVRPTRRPDEAVSVRTTTRDEFDNRVPLEGSIDISLDADIDSDADPESGHIDCTLVNGRADAILPATPHRVVRVRSSVKTDNGSTALEARSNPSIVSTDLQLYFGDLHCHDFLSEAEGYTDDVYRWAIEDRAFDFVSIVPQLHGWLDNETWTISKYMNERFLDEGRFVTFLGFEWQHTGYGDKVVHYLGGDQPFLPVGDPRYDSAAGLYADVRKSDAFIISHHPSYPPGSWCSSTDYDCIDTDVERLIEIWSMHGSSEGYDPDDRPMTSSDPSRRVMAALKRGVRLGFVAGSDTHGGRPGGSAKEPRQHWGGFAAVWAEKLTRRSLFEALRNRQTYALTRARIVLKMTVNGALMGSEIPECESADIRVDVWAPGTIRTVEIMKNGDVLQTHAVGNDECHLQVEDETGGPTFYHCRVTLTDGNLAVCSPVWVG